MDYPILASRQLTAQLKALRKAKNLTQAQLGKLVGVGQARMAQIEANPGVVNLEQLLKVLHLLGARLVLRVPSISAEPAPTGSVGSTDQADW